VLGTDSGIFAATFVQRVEHLEELPPEKFRDALCRTFLARL